MSVEAIKNRLIMFHQNVRDCFSTEFAKDVLLPYNEIMIKCAGDNFSILINFYR